MEYIRYASKLENEVVVTIITRYAPEFLQQLNNLYVCNREFTGVGIYVEFKPIDESKIEKLGSPILNILNADVEGTEYGAVFDLTIEDGVVSMLEMVTQVRGDWPPVVNKFKIHEA